MSANRKKRKRKKKVSRLKITAAVLVLATVAGVSLYVLRLVFQKKYDAIVEKYALEYDIPEELLYAVIKTESNFDPSAVSSADARGLMQITPETFEWLQYRMGEQLPLTELFEPETNIRYGAFFLRYLLDEFGSAETAAAAYNAGVNCVKNWLASPQYSSDGRNLSYIPYPETRYYVIKVKTAAEAYRKLAKGE